MPRSLLPFLALLVFVFAPLSTGCDDFTFGRTLEGEIVDSGSRMKGSQTGVTQKISIVVKASKSDAKMDDVATGPSGTAIECLSTRCATVGVGTCHRFKCKFLARWNEPDVISCKHDKEIECKAGDGSSDASLFDDSPDDEWLTGHRIPPVTGSPNDNAARVALNRRR
jgi:hypothetical protein